MNIVDVIIILFILLMGLTGLKRGFFKELVMIFGTILALVLSFKLKDPLANFFCINLPFFDFKGVLQGAPSLSIVFYQLIAFLIIAAIVFGILRIIISVTGIFEKILSLTIVLGIPSKILGFLVGIVEGVVITFFALIVLSIPLHSVDIFMKSNIRSQFVTGMPLLKDSVGGINQAVEDIYQLTQNKPDEQRFDYDVMEILLKYKVVKPSLATKLVEKEKISGIEGIQELIARYE